MLATMLSTTSPVVRERVSENHVEDISIFGEQEEQRHDRRRVNNYTELDFVLGRLHIR